MRYLGSSSLAGRQPSQPLSGRQPSKPLAGRRSDLRFACDPASS